MGRKDRGGEQGKGKEKGEKGKSRGDFKYSVAPGLRYQAEGSVDQRGLH
jgi:hypothetical protein